MDKQKYIGLIKWFHDKAKDANYGFIQHFELGELFFHEQSIEKGQDIQNFKENKVVVFSSQESKNHSGKLEAIGVKLLSTEVDLEFLFPNFLLLILDKGKYSDYNVIQKEIHVQIVSLIENRIAEPIIEKLFLDYKNFINLFFQREKAPTEENLKTLLEICRNFFLDKYSEISKLIENRIDTEVAHKLWLESFIETCQVNFIASKFLFESPETQIQIINRCSESDKSDIFFRMWSALENIGIENKYNKLEEILLVSTKKYLLDQNKKIPVASLDFYTYYLKLVFWLEDFHENLEFSSFLPFVKQLPTQNQKKYVKKVLKYIAEEKSNILIEEFTSLNEISPQVNKLENETGNFKLDYSISIVLNVIAELKNQIKLEAKTEAFKAERKIYELILSQLKEPDDILRITGFFDTCCGRVHSVIEKVDDKGEKTGEKEYSLPNPYDKPNYGLENPICDGRKAFHFKTNEPSLSINGNSEFWWCANKKCFKPSRELHSSNDWEKYTLLDLLTILKIQFSEVDYEIYLNIINKANRFLKHLKCRECNHILHPKGQSQYAFYGVNHFVCKKEGCVENNKEIYLTHCINGYCRDIIDSRDSVKCKQVNPDYIGWYVCNYCHACCSDEKIEKRVQNVYNEILNKKINNPQRGHKEQGFLACNKCGDEMNALKRNQEEYQKILNWFIDNKDKSKHIEKSGQNKFGKYWFILKKLGDENMFRNKLKRYLQLGFQIPDFNKKKEKYLISEPMDYGKHSDNILVCESCGNTLDVDSDPRKSIAIKKYHTEKFGKPE